VTKPRAETTVYVWYEDIPGVSAGEVLDGHWTRTTRANTLKECLWAWKRSGITILEIEGGFAVLPNESNRKLILFVAE